MSKPFKEQIFGIGAGAFDVYLTRWRFTCPWRNMLMARKRATWPHKEVALFQLGFFLHKFHRGDYDRAFHDHPWGFWTFPLKSYREIVLNERGKPYLNVVKPFEWHYRPASYTHIVLDDKERFPVWTIVIPEVKNNEWGFYVSITDKMFDNHFPIASILKRRGDYIWVHNQDYLRYYERD